MIPPPPPFRKCDPEKISPSQGQGYLRPRCEAHIVERCRSESIHVMRTLEQSECCVCRDGQCFRDNLRPVRAVGGDISGELVANPGQFHPHVRERVRSATDRAIKVVLHLNASAWHNRSEEHTSELQSR